MPILKKMLTKLKAVVPRSRRYILPYTYTTEILIRSITHDRTITAPKAMKRLNYKQILQITLEMKAKPPCRLQHN